MKTKERLSVSNYRRILEIDQFIASGRYPNVLFLMDCFGRSEATILRGIETMRCDFGADIEYDRYNKGYYYTKPYYRLPASFTTEKQIIAAKLMENLLQTVRGTPVYNQAIEVFKSFDKELEKDDKLDSKKLSKRIVFLGMEAVEIEGDVWNKLELAMSKNNYVAFDYEKNGEVYDVAVAPWQLVYFKGMWTLYGFNPKYKKPMMYNLIIIKNLTILKETFEPPEDFEFEKHSIGNFGKYIDSEICTYKIKIRKEKIDYIKTYKWSQDQAFEDQPDGSSIMTFTSNQYFPILDWVLEKGMYATPLVPEKLVDDWKTNVLKMAEELK